MALLTKAQILGADDRKYEIVEVPEWGGQVRVGSITGAQRAEYEDALIASEKTKEPLDVTALLLSMALVDEAGAAMFTRDDVAGLAAKSSNALRRVYAVASRLNTLSQEAKEEKKGN